MKRQIVVDALLTLCGAVLFYEFFIIMTDGRICPVPNLPVYGIGAAVILSVIGLGLWGAKTARSSREKWLSILLFAVGCGLLIGHVIFPIFVLVDGYSVSFYYACEPNATICLGELIVFGIFGLVGLGNTLFDIHKLNKLRRAAHGEKS